VIRQFDWKTQQGDHLPLPGVKPAKWSAYDRFRQLFHGISIFDFMKMSNHLLLLIIISMLLGACSNARYRHLTRRAPAKKVVVVNKTESSYNVQSTGTYTNKIQLLSVELSQKNTLSLTPDSNLFPYPLFVDNKLKLPRILSARNFVHKAKTFKIRKAKKALLNPRNIDYEDPGGFVAVLLMIIAIILTIQVLKVLYITWGCLGSILWPIFVFMIIFGLLIILYGLLTGTL